MRSPRDVIEDAERHRRSLFGLCYRMTGCPADAEELVQETFARALERPPADLDASIRPWLFKVATRLCVDHLRRRARYFGPWLPGPVDTERLVDDLEPGPEARLGVLESASAAFLLAIHTLEPQARAVLVLRDVLGLSAIEVGGMLDLEPGHVRVLHHRARRALEVAKEPSLPADVDAHAAALMRLLEALGRGDAKAAVALLADDAVNVQDANGAYVAAVRVIRGSSAIVDFYEKITKLRAPPSFVLPQSLNGLPALALVYPELEPRYAPRAVISVALDAGGRIAAIRGVLAPRKLAAVSFPTP